MQRNATFYIIIAKIEYAVAAELLMKRIRERKIPNNEIEGVKSQLGYCKKETSERRVFNLEHRMMGKTPKENSNGLLLLHFQYIN